MILLIALANASAWWLGLVIPNVSLGVSSKVSMCADSCCDDMFAGVGRWDGVLVLLRIQVLVQIIIPLIFHSSQFILLIFHSCMHLQSAGVCCDCCDVVTV